MRWGPWPFLLQKQCPRQSWGSKWRRKRWQGSPTRPLQIQPQQDRDNWRWHWHMVNWWHLGVDRKHERVRGINNRGTREGEELFVQLIDWPLSIPPSQSLLPCCWSGWSISQGVADGSEAVIGHGKQNTRLYDIKSMNKVGLGEAGPVANLSVVQPQNAPNCGHHGQCHSKVGGCQHS